MQFDAVSHHMCLLFLLSLNLGWKPAVSHVLFMAKMCRLCSSSAQAFFDLLLLEDVQYLSVQFPIILPVDRSNSSTTSESGNYRVVLPVSVKELRRLSF